MKVVIGILLIALVGYVSPMPRDERDTLGSIVDQFTNTLKGTLKGYGLNDEQQLKFVKEFVEVLGNIPIPPLSTWDMMNPLKIYKYVQEVTAFVQDVYARITGKAMAEVAKVGLEGRIEKRFAFLFNFTLPGGKILLNGDLGAVKTYLIEKFQELGLPIGDQGRLLKQYEDFLKSLPRLRPLELLNPFKVLQFVQHVTIKVGEFVANVINEAENLVRGILGTQNPLLQ